ncbi:MAG: restriction endonuclease subunit S [Candidatus Coatesbacteria bacterium]|nr:restriction endonuclease subunit S [Candidatus Coatesbacteria bacterium]
MPSEWPTTAFDEGPLLIIDGDRGKNYPQQEDYAQSGHCLFLNAGNVTTDGFDFSKSVFITAERDEVLRKGKLHRNDVVLTTRGTVGNVAYFDESIKQKHVRINSGMVILRAQPQRLLPRYLYMFVRSSLFRKQVEALRTGSAQPQLPIKDMNRIEMPLPPLAEQRAIAHILGTLDDKIELNRRMNETLEEMARAVFKSWFVDFDPVHAKAEGRDTGLPKEIADLFPDSFEDSELGEIPRGWAPGKLGDLLSRRKNRVGARTCVVLSAVASGELAKSDEHFKKRVYSKTVDKYIPVEQWDYAYNPSRINIGSIGMLKESFLGAVSPVYVVFRPRAAYRFFVELTLERPTVRKWIHTLASGSVRQSLSYSDFGSIPCVIPGEPVIERFNGLHDELRSAILFRSEESSTLASSRDALLPKLVSGEIRVPDVERFLGSRNARA